MQKLEQACKTVSKLTNEANMLRDINSNLCKDHDFLERKLDSLKKEQDRFAKDINKICC
jgi:FtsZ-binding cell division protein ZapB